MKTTLPLSSTTTIDHRSKAWYHFFVLSHVLKLHTINLICLYTCIVEVEYWYICLIQKSLEYKIQQKRTNFNAKKKMAQKKTK